MPDILITEFMDETAVRRLKGGFDAVYDPTLVDRPDELLRAITDTRAIIVRNRTQVCGELLEKARKLSCVGRLGVGLDNIDVKACETRNVAVYPATGVNNLPVAEYVVTAALILLRDAWLSTASVGSGAWPRETLIGREMAGKTLGLVGLGAIAREVAWRANALGMQVIACDPNLDAADPAWKLACNVSLDGLLEIADAVSLHVPLTNGTKNMIGAAQLARMRPGAVLINTARGGVVDEDALADALREERLAGAALDVFEAEPLSAKAGAKFAGIRNLLLTPHIAGVTEESNKRVSELIADTVAAHLDRN